MREMYWQRVLKKHRMSKCRGGGMADANDSKSFARKGMWVRLPPAALSKTASPGGGCFHIRGGAEFFVNLFHSGLNAVYFCAKIVAITERISVVSFVSKRSSREMGV